ncbi:MAG: carboxypeptidase regulatory-like domain-containing protein [Vicinamibacterales bacterium]
MKRVVAAVLGVACSAQLAAAQSNSQIFGRATDASGAVLPGVTVTVTSPVLLQPRVSVTSETGSYQFPGLGIGVYSVRFELAGFRTVEKAGIQLQAAFNAQVNAELPIATLAEDVIVTGTTPIIDIRSTTQGARFNQTELQALPTGRDIFSMLDKAPAVVVATQNVGGSNLGQQNTFLSRGASAGQVRTFSDGADTGTGNNLPFYLDFDSFDEVQINTGGADVTMQTSGATINMITKSGSDRFKGSARGFLTDQRFEANNVSDEQRRRGTTAGSPILNIKDYGFEVGGPIKKGRAWFWGGLSRQSVAVGANNFYKKTGDCAAVAAAPVSFPIGDVRKCLEPSTNDLRHVNYKITLQPFQGNQFSFRNSYDLKLQLNRGASDLNPFASTTRLTAVPESLGPKFWTTGWPPFWRFGDQHTFSDRFMVEVAYARFCPCTYIALAEDSLTTVQPMFEVATGMWDRSFSESINFTIKNNLDVIANYFLPGRLGGDHSLRAGYKYFFYPMTSTAHTGGNAIARFNSGRTLPAFSTPFSALFSRDSLREQYLYQHSLYFQDTYTRGRVTLIAGFRFDRQEDTQGAAVVPASPFQGQATMNGGTFNFFPAVNFPGLTGMPVWNNFAPRLGATWDIFNDGRTVLKGSYAQYYDQRSPGQISGFLNTIGANTLELPWQDLNGDKTVQANEVDSSRILSFSSGFDPANPGLQVSPNRVDPNLRNARTDEVVVGFNKELPGQIGVSASYVWRSYSDFLWNDRIGVTSADYTQASFAPSAASCPTGARCETVTYWVPNFALPASLLLTNQPDHYRKFNGVELMVRKRLSSRWMLNGSFAYNSTVLKYDSPDSYEDPTNIAQQHNAQYAPGVASGGLDPSNPNAMWITRFQGSYRLPWYEVGLAATVDLRQGYPLLPSINIASRPNRAGAVQVLLDPVGDVRLPVFSSTDFRVDKSWSFGARRMQLTLDVFNLFNASTDLARRMVQNAANANLVSQVLAPRVARFGASLTF